MPSRCFTSLLATSALALAGATPAQAGLVDASLNNAHVLSGSNILGAMVSAHIGDDANNNATSRVQANVQRDGSIAVNAGVSPDRRVSTRLRRAFNQRGR